MVCRSLQESGSTKQYNDKGRMHGRRFGLWGVGVQVGVGGCRSPDNYKVDRLNSSCRRCGTVLGKAANGPEIGKTPMGISGAME